MDLTKEILLKEGKMLPVMEHFYTLQGEGHHTGKAAYFIRLGGCDVGCHWCDVKESWDPDLHRNCWLWNCILFPFIGLEVYSCRGGLCSLVWPWRSISHCCCMGALRAKD